MNSSSTDILIADMVYRTQSIMEAAGKIEALYKLAAEKQDNPHFERVLFLDAQDNLGAVVKLEDKLCSYAEMLRNIAGLSVEDGKSIGQFGCSRKADGGN